MAAPASATGSYEIPSWAVKNSKIFAGGHPEEKAARSTPVPSTTLAVKSGGMEAAVGMAVRSGEQRGGGIFPPTGPAPAAYFRDVNNHAEVLSTIISTARTTAGFLPELTGAHLTPQQAEEYVRRFNAFIQELDRYFAYVDVLSAATQTVQNNAIDCDAMINVISSVLATAMRESTHGSAFEALEQRVSGVIKSAVDYVSTEGKSTSAGFEMVGLHPPPQQGIQAPPNPISAVTFTITTLRKTSGKASSQESFLSIATYTYQLRSTRIILDANLLAGARIVGVDEFERNINALLSPPPHK